MGWCGCENVHSSLSISNCTTCIGRRRRMAALITNEMLARSSLSQQMSRVPRAMNARNAMHFQGRRGLTSCFKWFLVLFLPFHFRILSVKVYRDGKLKVAAVQRRRRSNNAREGEVKWNENSIRFSLITHITYTVQIEFNKQNASVLGCAVLPRWEQQQWLAVL